MEMLWILRNAASKSQSDNTDKYISLPAGSYALYLMEKSDLISNALASNEYKTSSEVICGSTLNFRHSDGKFGSHFYVMK